MRKYKEWSNIRLTFGIWCSLWVSIPCFLQDTNHIYWSYPPKQFYPIKSTRTWKKSDQIFKSYALQNMETNFPKNTTLTNAYDWGNKWGRHTKDKTKSNPFARLKVRIFSKSVVYKIHVSLQSRAWLLNSCSRNINSFEVFG